MPGARLELARFCGAPDFESGASANSAIPARKEVADILSASLALWQYQSYYFTRGMERSSVAFSLHERFVMIYEVLEEYQERLSMARTAVRQSPERFSDTLIRVVTKRERVVVHRRGKAVAALIPLEDLALLEELEDQKDVEEYRAAKAEWEREGKKTVPWAKIKADLSL